MSLKETPSSAAPERPAILSRADGATIAYHRRLGTGPGVVFLGGFMSDMTGTKATRLDAFCVARGQGYLRFDYFAHGASSGDFAEATVGRWAEDAVAMLDALTAGPQILVGSSIGGWIMLLAAVARPERVAALVGIAAAPDATALMWDAFSAADREALLRDGAIRRPSAYSAAGYLYTRKLIEDGRRHLLLHAPIPVRAPVRLLHGMQDPDVPWQQSLALAERLESADVQLVLVKDGDHRLSTERDLALLERTIASLTTSAASARP
jgi:pimeloyl-ACP methyl ester carboxylesterase